MKYFIFFLSAFLIFNTAVHAQQKQHKIVFEMVSADTADHRHVIRQIKNVLKVSPDTKIEIVFHSRAIYALIKDSSSIMNEAAQLTATNGVIFAACNNSLNRFHLTKEQLIPSATVVPVAILELTDKQEKGWSYIRSGH